MKHKDFLIEACVCLSIWSYEQLIPFFALMMTYKTSIQQLSCARMISTTSDFDAPTWFFTSFY